MGKCTVCPYRVRPSSPADASRSVRSVKRICGRVGLVELAPRSKLIVHARNDLPSTPSDRAHSLAVSFDALTAAMHVRASASSRIFLLHQRPPGRHKPAWSELRDHPAVADGSPCNSCMIVNIRALNPGPSSRSNTSVVISSS
jgi:hypothetical protein